MHISQNPPADRVHPSRVELETPTEALAVVSLVGDHDLAEDEPLRQALHPPPPLLSVRGDPALAEEEPLRQALDLAAARRHHLIVDLTECTFIDSTVVSL